MLEAYEAKIELLVRSEVEQEKVLEEEDQMSPLVTVGVSALDD